MPGPIPISALPDASALGGSEEVVLNQAGATKEDTISDITAFVEETVAAGAAVGSVNIADEVIVNQGGVLKTSSWASSLLALMGRIDITMLGAVRGGVTDCTSAWLAAKAAVDMAGLNGGAAHAGPRVYFPPGDYLFNSTLVVDKTMILEGDGGTGPGAQASRLHFPASTTGIEVTCIVASPLTSGGNGSIIKNLGLYSAGGSDTTQHGIWVRGQVTISQCLIWGFPGAQIYLNNSVTGSGSLLGNANGFYFERCDLYFGQYGLYIAGSDSNAGVTIGLNIAGSTRWGIYEASGLGNTHIGAQTASVGGGAMCSYGGHLYYSLQDNNIGNEPDTSPTWWQVKDTLPSGFCPAWTSGATFNAGGPYWANTSLVSENIFLSCYSESDSPPSVGNQATQFHGGQLAAGFWPTSVAPWLTSNSNGFVVINNSSGAQVTDSGGATVLCRLGDGANQAKTNALRFSHSSWAPNYWNIKFFSADAIRLDYNNSDSEVPWYITNPSTTWQFGTGASQPFLQWFPSGFILGASSTTARKIAAGTAAPTTGAHANGEIQFNNTVVAGGNIGWVCTTAGTPGTWTPFGNIGLEGTATYDPPSLTAGLMDTIQSMTVTGAALGDLVDASFTVDLAGVSLRAWVSAANTVKYVFHNQTTGTVDLASGTVKCRIRK